MSYYQWYEMTHAALSPARAVADATRLFYKNPLNPLTHTSAGRSIAASCELFERVTRRYGKPEFGLDTTLVGAMRVQVHEEIVWQRPFGQIIHFRKSLPANRSPGPKLLIVAPMSGHYATLLRGTVETMLPYHDVYVTDWIDARMVPMSEGPFDLDDYIDYVISVLRSLGGDTHVMAVCQPSVPVLAAVAVMEARGDAFAPRSMTLMGGPIDTRVNPTAVNQLAEERDLDWFRRNAIMQVPFPHPGFMRHVYPGFLQLTGFMSMNLDRHMAAHRDLFYHLIEGDGDNAEKHRDFYDEYLAVMDLTAEFYLQTVDTVFIRHSLPKGEMTHRGEPVDLTAIKRTALMTVEGEKDDISGVGQTEAAHTICPNIPDEKREHYVQPKVGHYGVFNGSRFNAEIAPRIKDFILSNNGQRRRDDGIVGVVKRSVSRIKGSATRSASTKANGKAPVATSSGNGAVPVDDLKQISGIGPKLEDLLNSKGITSFAQIAALDTDSAANLETEIGTFQGRIARDGWVDQAKDLAKAKA